MTNRIFKREKCIFSPIFPKRENMSLRKRRYWTKILKLSHLYNRFLNTGIPLSILQHHNRNISFSSCTQNHGKWRKNYVFQHKF